MQTGKPDELPVFKYEIFVPESGQWETYYWSNLNQPVAGEQGLTAYLINTTANVTERIKQIEALDNSLEREHDLNNELAAINEELRSLNEELATSNEEMMASNEELAETNLALNETQSTLQTTVSLLELSQSRFQTLVKEATIGIIVLMGKEMKVEIVNKSYGRLIGRTVEELLGNTLFTIIPESEASFRPVIDNVRLTGETLYLYDTPYLVYHNGEKIEGFLNLVYQPYLEDDQSITGVIVLCQDVTEQVTARKDLDRAYEQVRLSKEAAQLGTFDMDLEKGTLEWDPRCRELFGISHTDEVTYDKDFITGLHPEDRERVISIINNVFVKAVSNGAYDVEYRTLGAEDQQLRWVRAKGQAYFDEQDKPYRFIGSVLDITEQKQDELRKNDFIGMVSHELKTPITSLNAYVQVLQGRAVKADDDFAIGALVKIKSQVNKMTSLVNGFLNISRFDSGKIHLDLQSFNLDELLAEVMEETKLIAPSYTIVMQPCQPVSVNADRDKIGQVLSNLLSNAVKYSPKGKTITLCCEQMGDIVQVSVQDEGMGVKPESVGNLFERYYRVETKHTQHISGFGIGLYLCAEIIERHKGKIWAESEIGKGSTFYFTLPHTSTALNQ